MKITVVGMGKIGLPLAVSFALHGNTVTGLEIQGEVVNLINAGQEPFPGEAHLSEYLKEAVNNKLLQATTNAREAIAKAEVLVVCIPLMINHEGDPDFKNIDSLVLDIGRHLSPGALVCFETTLPVGTTKDRFSKSLAKESGLTIGRDFFVVFSPERVLTGRIFEDLHKYPKLVGGVTQECTKRGASFYQSVIDFEAREDLGRQNGVWEMENSCTAEFVKIAETTFRDVNIGLANEFAVFAKSKGIDIHAVINAANSQPFSQIHNPGIAVGGHCIPVYPKFYTWKNLDSQIVTAARQRNQSMPERSIEQIIEVVGSLKGQKILILGITYRPGVKEVALSGATALLHLLKSNGAIVFGHDPFFDDQEVLSFGFDGVGKLGGLGEMGGIILHTNHPDYAHLDFSSCNDLKFLYDGRNAFPTLVNQSRFKYLSV
jgi:UDP-N-acetyl-D-glucosamine dehydrogenase